MKEIKKNYRSTIKGFKGFMESGKAIMYFRNVERIKKAGYSVGVSYRFNIRITIREKRSGCRYQRPNDILLLSTYWRKGF